MRGIFKTRHFNDAVSENTYCGRCGDHLPDETLSYCPTCGILFSEVSPTVEYELFSERVKKLEGDRQSRNFVWGVLSGFLLIFLVGVFLLEVSRSKQFGEMRLSRKVVFYIQDFPQFKSLHPMVKRHAINIAVQSFSDHFGFQLKEWEVREGVVPSGVSGDASLFREWSFEKEELSYWQKVIGKRVESRWRHDPYGELAVFVSNFPMYASAKDSPIETRHLSSSKLIGGLGSPGLVVISSYRLIHELEEKNPDQQARYLGEYLLAHELGHALLGIKDSVLSPNMSRSLASIYKSKASADAVENIDAPYDHCLMHTDAGGGYYMWDKIQNRELGVGSRCSAYSQILSAHRLRELAIRHLRSGQREEAFKNYQRALEKLDDSDALSWLRYQWKKERIYYLSSFRAWWEQLFPTP